MASRSRSKKIVAVDWDARTLRLVPANLGKKKVTILDPVAAPIPTDVDPSDPEQMGHFIRETLHAGKISARHAIVDIPRDQAILNTLSLPCHVPDELAGIVEIQIAKELPFPVADAVIDFTIGSVEPSAPTGDVLVAAVRREVLAQYEATFAAAGLKLDRIGLRPYANRIAVCEFLQHEVPDRVLFVDVRPLLTEINVLHDGALAFSRAASVTVTTEGLDRLKVEETEGPGSGIDGVFRPVGLPGDDGVSKSVRALVMDVSLSIDAYRAGDPGAVIDQVVIGGDTGTEEALAEAIQSELQIPTEIYNPASLLGCEPDEGAAVSAFAASFGLVLGHASDDEVHFDFLHPKKVVTKREKQLKAAPILAAAIALFPVAGILYLEMAHGHERAALKKVDEEIDALKKKARDEDWRDFKRLNAKIKEYDEDMHVCVDDLLDVMAHLPPTKDLVVDSIEFHQRVPAKSRKKKGKDGKIILETRSKESDTVLAMVAPALHDFRRPGHSKPRFRVSAKGGLSEHEGAEYPYQMKLEVFILDDE